MSTGYQPVCGTKTGDSHSERLPGLSAKTQTDFVDHTCGDLTGGCISVPPWRLYWRRLIHYLHGGAMTVTCELAERTRIRAYRAQQYVLIIAEGDLPTPGFDSTSPKVRCGSFLRSST